VLLIPVLASTLAALPPVKILPVNLWFQVLTAFAAGALATAYVGFDLPSAGNARKPYTWYLRYCLAPLTFAAIQFNTFWAWLPDGGPAPWWDLVGLGRTGLHWWHFAGFGALMHGGGMLAGILFARFRYRRPPTLKGLIASAAALVTGVAAGAVGFGFSGLAARNPDGALLHPDLYAWLA